MSQESLVYATCCADTGACTSKPTETPTHAPSTLSPTPSPSPKPSPKPTLEPSPEPSPRPTHEPSHSPTTVADPTFDTCSASTCADLGWDGYKNYGSELVCGSLAADGCTGLDGHGGGCLPCSGRVDCAGARAYCEASGARLCTAAELINDEARGGGCGYDSELVWSSTRCSGTTTSFYAVSAKN